MLTISSQIDSSPKLKNSFQVNWNPVIKTRIFKDTKEFASYIWVTLSYMGIFSSINTLWFLYCHIKNVISTMKKIKFYYDQWLLLRLSPSKCLWHYFPLMSHRFNLLGISRSHSFKYCDWCLKSFISIYF